MTLYCIGRNYSKHIQELNSERPSQPVVFLKSEASMRGLVGQTLQVPDVIHHEVELVVRLGTSLQVGERGNWGHVDALTLGLDLTRRAVQQDLKARGLPWTTSKSFVGSAIVAPFVDIKAICTPKELTFELSVNGEPRQTGDTTNMLFDVPTLITYLASFNQLRKGDLIFTGTPHGVNTLNQGDTFEMVLKSNNTYKWTGAL